MTATLYYDPGSAAMVPHIVLEEIGAPYERMRIERAKNEHKRQDFLQLNPNGLIPVLREGDLVLYETAAIVLHLCDRHPQAQLAPAVGSDERAHFYKWLAWLTNTLQPTLLVYYYPERWMRPGNTAAGAELKMRAQERVADMLHQLDSELARHRGPWLMGTQYSAIDAYVFTLCRWTRHFTSGRARDRAHLGPYLQRMLARPAVQRVLAIEEIAPPYV
jgi:glutathione S-transferase